MYIHSKGTTLNVQGSYLPDMCSRGVSTRPSRKRCKSRIVANVQQKRVLVCSADCWAASPTGWKWISYCYLSTRALLFRIVNPQYPRVISKLLKLNVRLNRSRHVIECLLSQRLVQGALHLENNRHEHLAEEKVRTVADANT